MVPFTRQLARFVWLAVAVVICAVSAADAAAMPGAIEPRSTDDGTTAIRIAKDREVNNRSVARGQDREGDLDLSAVEREMGSAPAWLAQHATNRKPWLAAIDASVLATDLILTPAFVPQRLPLPPPAC